MEFDVARENFVAACRRGLAAHFELARSRGNIPAQRAPPRGALPAGPAGLQELDIDSSDIDRYLGVVEERVRSLAPVLSGRSTPMTA